MLIRTRGGEKGGDTTPVDCLLYVTPCLANARAAVLPALAATLSRVAYPVAANRLVASSLAAGAHTCALFGSA
jgi:hypothetical protein